MKKKDDIEITEKSEEKEGAEITIEEGLARLDEILLAMESKGTDLTESFNLYEEGIRLLKGVSSQIDTVEKKVMMLREGQLGDFTPNSDEVE